MKYAFLAAALSAALLTQPAQAQEGKEFFEGKTMTYIVSTSAGAATIPMAG